IGLLIGAERERRKGEGPSRSAAGIRTFTITSLAGAVSVVVGGELLLAIATIGVVALTALGYWRSHEDVWDPFVRLFHPNACKGRPNASQSSVL
ncbi:MAG: MgtC/SapB family protein, partial [Methyloceanibacter sp.]